MDDAERRFLERARRGFLATADGEGRPAAVPVCFALDGDVIVTPLDEKPKDAGPRALRRVRDVEANPRVALVVDSYDEDWSELAWVQVRGMATLDDPGDEGHGDVSASHEAAVVALRAKYEQYADHALEERPLLRIAPGHVVSWVAEGDSL